MDVGFMGLGAMGRPMARNLAAAGHSVVAWNRTPADPPEGVTLVDSARAVGERADVAFLMVSDAEAVEQVVFGNDGWAAGAGTGAVLIQSSTIGPTATARVSSQVAEAGFGYLDAPVSGSVKPAENAQLTILGGGDQTLFDRYQGLFDAIAARTVVFGPIGSGSTAKLAVNGLLVAVIGAAAETMTWLVERDPNVDVELFSSVIERISPLAAARAGSITGTAPEGGFSLRQAAKDMELVGQELGTSRVMNAVRELTRRGLEVGFHDKDVACLGEVARQG